MSARPHVLVVGGNDSALLEAASLGIDFTLFQLPERVTDTQIGACGRTFLFDFTDEAAAVELGRVVHRLDPVTAVVSFWEKGLLPAARLAEAIGAAGNPIRPVLESRDKLSFRKATELLCAADYAPVTKADDAIRFLEEVGAPIVIKPSAGSGSLGVFLVSDPHLAPAAVERAARSGAGPVLAERYVDGDEYSVETLTLSGQHVVAGITRKTTTGPPRFIELAHEFPAEIDAALHAELSLITTKMLDLIGHRHGPAHTEFRVSPDGPFPIETHTRFGGDQIWELVKLTTGMSLAGRTIAHLAGVAPAPEEITAPAAAISYFALENCRVDSVGGLDEAAAMPGVIRVACTLQPGRRLGPLSASADRQGYVLAVADRPALARERANAAKAKVRIGIS